MSKQIKKNEKLGKNEFAETARQRLSNANKKPSKNPPPPPEILKNPQKTLPRPPKTLKKPSPETFLRVLAPEYVTKGGRARTRARAPCGSI